jgi:membrane-associated phospholipid phosphatase
MLFTNQNLSFAQGLDYKWTYKINSNTSAPKSNFYNHYSNTAVVVSLAVPASLWLAKNKKHSAIIATSAWLINGGSTFILKKIVNRERPYSTFPQIVNRYHKKVNANNSFPSGHTSTTFAAAASISIAYPKWYVILPAYTYAAIMGYARIYQGVHYPSDVLGGVIVGVGSAYISKMFYKLYQNKKPKHNQLVIY